MGGFTFIMLSTSDGNLTCISRTIAGQNDEIRGRLSLVSLYSLQASRTMSTVFSTWYT